MSAPEYLQGKWGGTAGRISPVPEGGIKFIYGVFICLNQ